MLKYSKKNNINKKYYNISKNHKIKHNLKKIKLILGGANIASVNKKQDESMTPQTRPNSDIKDRLFRLSVNTPISVIEAILNTVKASADVVTSSTKRISEMFREQNTTLEGIRKFSNPNDLNKSRIEYENLIKRCVKLYNSQIPEIIEGIKLLIKTQKKELDHMLYNICPKTFMNYLRAAKYRSCKNSSKSNTHPLKQSYNNIIVSKYAKIINLYENHNAKLTQYRIDNNRKSIVMLGITSGIRTNDDIYNYCIDYKHFINKIIYDIEQCNPYKVDSPNDILYSTILKYKEELNKLNDEELNNILNEQIKKIDFLREKETEELPKSTKSTIENARTQYNQLEQQNILIKKSDNNESTNKLNKANNQEQTARLLEEKIKIKLNNQSENITNSTNIGLVNGITTPNKNSNMGFKEQNARIL